MVNFHSYVSLPEGNLIKLAIVEGPVRIIDVSRGQPVENLGLCMGCVAESGGPKGQPW